MIGDRANHSLITVNLPVALSTRLGDGSCQALGPDAGVETLGNAVRYPDALVAEIYRRVGFTPAA